MRKSTHLVLALDVTDREQALSIARAVGDSVDAVKVNYPLVLSCGMGLVSELSKTNDVICDFKIADIPNTNRLIVEQAVKHGATGVICHAFVGKDSLEACVKAAEGREVFVVTEMSHPGAAEFTSKHGETFAKMAVETGATGIIAPATRPYRITELRKIVGPGMKIMSPGVGAQGGSVSETIKAGADHVIVGRRIYQSDDPAKVAGEYSAEIKRSLI